MDNVETQIQKHLVTFCKFLPTHVDFWRSILQESGKVIQTLTNLFEQWHHVHRAKLKYLDNFEVLQNDLLCQISSLAEEEILKLKELIDKLNKSNFDLKNKLLAFERSTLNLDWERNTELIRGNGLQPSLSTILGNGLTVLNVFLKYAKNISDAFKALNLNDEKSIKNLQTAFDVNVKVDVIVSLLALTQYVDNDKGVS